MKPTRFFQTCLLVAVVLGLLYGCNRNREVDPTVTLATLDTLRSVSVITDQGAQLTSTLQSTGRASALAYGHVWSKTNQLPTLADAKSEFAGTPASVPHRFTSQLTDLAPTTRYYVRAYVTNPAGTAYGPVTSFQTRPDLYGYLSQILTDSLKNRGIGYGFVVYEKAVLKSSGSGGLKSRSLDAEGEKAYGLDTKMHMASLSKTLTTMALLRLLAEKGLKTTDPVASYLPPSWVKGENMGQLTFRQLLRHESGLVGLGGTCANGAYSENSWSGLKALVQKGVTTPNQGRYCYQNANFGLLRVVIPGLLGYPFTGNDATDDAQTQQRYVEYVQKNVLEKVGITGALPTHPPGDPTYTYDYPFSGRAGWNQGNFAPTTGAYGWYLSPREAGKLYATVLSSPDESVLKTAWKDSLLTRRLGSFAGTTVGGTLHYHDGWWYLNAGQYQGIRAIWMKFPGDVTVVLFVNALHRTRGLFPSNDGTDIAAYVNRAYARAKQLKAGRSAAITLTLEHPEPH